MNKLHLLTQSTLLLAAFTSITQAAGPLTPPGAPGAPAADMPSLLEVKSAALTCRKEIPASTTTVLITTPGSYVLCGNITVAAGNGILISASCVTLDMNGFCISSTNPASTGAGIAIQGAREDVTIRNGHISSTAAYNDQSSSWGGAGFADGINLRLDGANWADNVNIDTVTVSGVRRHGIYCGEEVIVNTTTLPVISVAISSNVRDCSVRMCGGAGVVATNVNQCVVRQAYAQAVVAHSVSNCSASSFVSDGVVSYTATNCSGTSDGGGRGVAGHQSLNCRGSSKTGYGVEAYTASNCQGVSIDGQGIHATIANGCIGSSTSATTNQPGIWAGVSVSNSSGEGKPGIQAVGSASFCVGTATVVGGDAINALKAFSCQALVGNIVVTGAGAGNVNTGP